MAAAFIAFAAFAASIGADSLALIGEDTENPTSLYVFAAAVCFGIAGLGVAIGAIALLRANRAVAWLFTLGLVVGSAVVMAELVAGQLTSRTAVSAVVGLGTLLAVPAVGTKSLASSRAR